MHPLDEYLRGERASVPKEIHDLSDPWVDAGQLVFPFPLDSGEMAAAVVGDIDLSFLRKMSGSWLKQIRETVQERYESIRLSSIDPETELYNRRALHCFLEDLHEEHTGFLFLINTVFSRKTATANLQKLKETADLLTTVGHGQYFAFGYGVFGLYLPFPQRKVALKTARHLQRQLRREGMSKVQIGFARIDGSQTGNSAGSLDRYWQALELAEKRGPFGLCDIDAFEARHSHPFLLADAELLEQGKSLWSRQRRFTLALITFHHTEVDAVASWVAFREENMSTKGRKMLTHGHNVLLILPDRLLDAVALSVESIVEDARRRFGGDSFIAGVASWPCLDFTKSEVVGNCLKAQRHAAFFGPGSMVFFDHLSLNISGDYFFDEGDYRSALREYRRGLRLQPGDVNLINSLGVTLIECNQLRAAANCFQEALQQESANYMALVNLGKVRQTFGQQDRALECFERAFDAHGEDQSAGQELFLPLALLYTHFGLYSKAINVLERWLLKPGSDQEFLLFRLLGLCAMESGQPEKAIPACQRALRLFPQDNVSLSVLGLLYVEQGEGSELGLSLCNKALALDNFNPDHWYRLGRALLHAGEFERALEACGHCLRLQRTHGAGMVQLGIVHKTMGRMKQARNSFLKAMAQKGCTGVLLERAQSQLAAC
ncbi:tetratricopeptide repeat protein [uncultured Vibrio sp.]|uniref:tetratricopeptide repeat protein n=1 Tax=uncultured Vibrio sp. TaxID=114054 RepID=UPI002AA7B060|nr:tetratricopeptide repeat protein [uncultured Vibrio sp.]